MYVASSSFFDPSALIVRSGVHAYPDRIPTPIDIDSMIRATLEIRGGNDERLARFAASAMSCRNLLLWHGTGVRMHDLHHLAS